MADIYVRTCSGFGLAAVMARKAVPCMAIGDALKIDPPIGPAIKHGAP
ncbi:hypothetical protein [Sphingomonas sp. Root720]|nr:hypothetical protein [Sphingomonas sp. Root720]